jgi:hypothetical protein
MTLDEQRAAWLNDETPGIYIWKVRFGWRFRVMFQFAGTTAMWRLTKRGAVKAAERIVREEG